MTAQPAKSPPRHAPRRPSPDRSAAIAKFAGDDFDRDVWCVLGLPIDAVDLAAAAAAVEQAARLGRRLSFVTPNVNWLVRAFSEPGARRQILNADLSLADGAPLVALARLLGAPIRARAAGSDLFEALAARPGFPGRRIRVFFFGGREGSAEAAHKALSSAPGGVEAAGWMNPGFGDVASMSTDAIIDQINKAAPDFVVVSLGAEKGQAWIEANQARLAAPVIAHLGAVVDFTAGAIRRAPPWVARAGFEWAWRIAQEPSLWRRYARDGIGLCRLIATRLAPQLFLARSSAPKPATAADAVVESGPDGAVVRLSGALVADGLGPVREAFRRVASGTGPVFLDLSAAQSADRAFLGLVLMLEKNLPQTDLTLINPPRKIAALFRANMMAYPVAETGPARPLAGSGMGRAAAG